MNSVSKQAYDEGISQGKAGLLVEQLQQRFGQLQPDLLVRIQSADSALLSTWGRRLLTAPDLESIFGGRRTEHRTSAPPS